MRILVFIVLAMFISCRGDVKSSKEDSSSLKGSGHVLRLPQKIKNFSRLEVSGLFNVFLMQSTVAGLEVETDENLQEHVLISQDGATLKIGLEKDLELLEYSKMNLYISVRDLDHLELACLGKVKSVNRLKSKSFFLRCNSIGETDIELETEDLSVDADIIGRLILSGKAMNAKIEHGGVGALEAFDLSIENLNLVAEGVGMADIHASDELQISAGGIGSVRYKGHPKTKKIRNSGIGKISAFSEE